MIYNYDFYLNVSLHFILLILYVQDIIFSSISAASSLFIHYFSDSFTTRASIQSIVLNVLWLHFCIQNTKPTIIVSDGLSAIQIFTCVYCSDI